MELDKKALGLSCGLLWGAAIFLLTYMALWRGSGEHLQLIGVVYIGYSVSPLGSLIGLAYGFVDGFIGGWLLAWLYNRLRARAQPAAA